MGTDVSNLNLRGRYVPSDDDRTSSTTLYYGFLDEDGSWYIMRTSVSGKIRSHRFVRGSGNYTTNWDGRTSQAYDTYDNVFDNIR